MLRSPHHPFLWECILGIVRLHTHIYIYIPMYLSLGQSGTRELPYAGPLPFQNRCSVYTVVTRYLHTIYRPVFITVPNAQALMPSSPSPFPSCQTWRRNRNRPVGSQEHARCGKLSIHCGWRTGGFGRIYTVRTDKSHRPKMGTAGKPICTCMYFT